MYIAILVGGFLNFFNNICGLFFFVLKLIFRAGKCVLGLWGGWGW